MKTVNGMSFGFSAVNAGQRNVAVEPQLIAVSTEGNFRMTPPKSCTWFIFWRLCYFLA